MHRLLIGIVLCLLITCTVSQSTNSAFIRLKSRKLSSQHDLSYSFYSIPVCRPDVIQQAFENLGDYLFGDRIENTVYNFHYNQNIKCQLLQHGEKRDNGRNAYDSLICPAVTENSLNNLIRKVQESYHVEMIAEGLPVANHQYGALCGQLPDRKVLNDIYNEAEGFPLGCTVSERKWILNNHWTFNIKYHENENGQKRVVAAYAIPSSINWSKHADECSTDKALPSEVNKLYLDTNLIGEQIPWSISVNWEKSDIKYASRWDAYLKMSSADKSVQWFSIVNSIMIVIFLTVMVAIIMLRILNRDIAYYNRDEEEPDETGWKLVHADVFRSPIAPGLLCVLVGSGVQVLFMCVISLAFSAIGFVSVAHRGTLIQIMAVLFALMGTPAGFVCIKLYKMMGGERWKGVTLLTAFLFPGIIFIVFSVINFLLLVGAHSSNAVPISQMFMVMGLWFFVSVPLVFFGSFIAWKQEALKHPVSVARLPRLIPPQSIWNRPWLTILLGGVLPFGAVFIQVYFIMSSIWLHKYYFVFGLAFVVFVILIVTCAEITIVLTYFQLCNENYHWWWRSFFTAGSTALYLMLYSCVYFFKLHVDSILLALIFFEYMGMVSFLFFLLTGSVGFISTLWFIRKIFKSIKVD